MRQKTNHILIGAFVLVGGALGVAAAVFFGAGALGRDRLIAETYLVESVQGLEIGAHVRFRGFRIGSVTDIGLTSVEYDSDQPFVLVRFSLRPLTDGQTPAELHEILTTRLGEGLRCRLASLGLTGALYVEADLYPDADRLYPPPEIDWTPKFLYIPSLPSVITQLGDSVESVLRKLESIDFPAVVGDARELMASLRAAVDGLDAAGLAADVHATLEELRGAVDRLAERGGEVLDAAEGLLAGIEPEQVRELVEELRIFAAGLQPAVASFQAAVDESRRAVGDVRAALTGRSRELDQILENARRIASSFANLADTLERYPSLMLFGNPPPERVR